ncbi:MAG TPA: zinc ribbon domain-containing protein [Syntrophales bacterium]|nr:zinc ribbon domain-containing protein [Syntrophales bacterium]HOM07476.1 zinc ribbon domain-containing protein [Syntrophales bacterium]HOO00011.1 zinc ribbon domain-containing protein [Syntrophales bacterium]HPC00875.1 zinc ribbon domain-containing protein [Syntrophales bacterium]HPQ07095.1 zinc ribbon domain-containing protein [Syntrophales bacterium]
MPIYEYRCRKCGKEFEVFQKITEPAVSECGFCRGPVDKLMSLSSFHLKGSGWYVTDYGGKKAPYSEGKKEEGGGAKQEGGASKE